MAEMSYEQGFDTQKLYTINNRYKKTFEDDIPLYSDEVLNILEDGFFSMSIKGLDRLEKEVNKRINNNVPFEYPDDYDDWMY